ncbi:MAG TPA: TolC family protein [Puia sp.]|nr:TolC family protein [Puia sp.]
MRIPKGFPALIICLSLALSSHAATGPDSLRLTLPEAENIFLVKNLELIARKYDVDINQAYAQQAKYWDNPVLNTDQNIYDGKFFRHDNNYGQVFLQIEELIKTAGKRSKLIRLSNDGVLSARQQFNDVMRNLLYLLRTDFFTLHELLETNNIYATEATSLQSLVKGMDAQLQSGNISVKENVRVKSLLYSLQSDQAGLEVRIGDLQKDLHVLLQIRGDTILIPSSDSSITFRPEMFNVQQLLDSARDNRPDLQLAKTNLLWQQHNLSYQKALAIPDLTVAVEYDQRSSYINNYYGLGISLPIPLLNTNKGNIRAAHLGTGQAETQVLQAQTLAEQEVTAAYRKLLIASGLQQQQPATLASNYEHLFHGMVQSYEQRQVSLLEFIDFFDAYKDAKTKQLQMETSLKSAAAEIDFTTATNMIRVN